MGKIQKLTLGDVIVKKISVKKNIVIAIETTSPVVLSANVSSVKMIKCILIES